MMDLTRYGSQECSQYDGDGEGDGESDSEDDSRGGCGDHAQILLFDAPCLPSSARPALPPALPPVAPSPKRERESAGSKERERETC